MAKNPLPIGGAYGRSGNLADWLAGKDFKVFLGSYCSIRDVERMRSDGYDGVAIYPAKGMTPVIWEFPIR